MPPPPSTRIFTSRFAPLGTTPPRCQLPPPNHTFGEPVRPPDRPRNANALGRREQRSTGNRGLRAHAGSRAAPIWRATAPPRDTPPPHAERRRTGSVPAAAGTVGARDGRSAPGPVPRRGLEGWDGPGASPPERPQRAGDLQPGPPPPEGRTPGLLWRCWARLPTPT